jgi:hypothetical protein
MSQTADWIWITLSVKVYTKSYRADFSLDSLDPQQSLLSMKNIKLETLRN